MMTAPSIVARTGLFFSSIILIIYEKNALFLELIDIHFDTLAGTRKLNASV